MGYVIEQLLITLATCAFLIPVMTVILQVLSLAIDHPRDLQDEVAVAQLRHVINASSEIDCTGNEVSLFHRGKTQRLALRNEKLCLIDPGTQIFLGDLEHLSFFIDDSLLYVSYAHHESQEQVRCLGHV